MPSRQTMHLHASYWTEPVALGPQHSNPLHQLAVSVSWPHRPADMDLLLDLGTGVIASDEIGRPLGSGMVFPYGADMAMIGMMMTHPKLQSGGLGAIILQDLIEAAGTTCLRLNATGSAHRLYRKAGFRETGSVTQYQGLVCNLPDASSATLRPAQETDFDRLVELDKASFGVARRHVLGKLWAVSETLVCLQGSEITGFAMCRLFGRGHVIGPLSAATEADACALVGGFLSDHAGGFLRLDADARHTSLGVFLNAAGLESYDTVTPMSRGGASGPEASDRTYALASQALG